MTTEEQIIRLRRMTAEPEGQSSYSNDDLSEIIDNEAGDLDAAASFIWTEKASAYSEMVDISEAGSSRRNSQLMTNAMDMASFYKGRATPPLPGIDSATTVPSIRG